jgi:hypothetical protein
MNLITRGASFLVFFAALAIGAGCSDSNFALVGRNTLPDRASQTLENEIEATVERLDGDSRQINLRRDDGRTQAVGYSTDARAIYRGREYPVSRLEVGDVVVMQLRQDSRGNFYTDLIRIQQSIRERDQTRGEGFKSSSAMQTLDGRVEQVDLQRNSFEIREPSRERVFVSLSNDARRSDVDRLRALRSGDYVRVEGRFLDRDRFELDGFLRDVR